MDSVEIKSVDAARVRRCMDDYAAQLLATNPAVEEIVVFGSFADDTYAPGSDLDVFIILASAPKNRRATGFQIFFPVAFQFRRTFSPSPERRWRSWIHRHCWTRSEEVAGAIAEVRAYLV